MITPVEGNRQWLDGGAMYGNAPRAVWERWSPPDARHRIPLACRSMLVTTDLPGSGRPQRVLFETGIGMFFDPALRDRYGVEEPAHRLLESLGAMGLSDADIDVVVLSHLHFDHAGGLLAPWEAGVDGQSARPARLLFPNAQFLVSDMALARATRPHLRDRASFIPELQGLLRESGRLSVVSTRPLSGGVGEPITHPMLGERFRFHFSEGHTPGLMCTEYADPDDADRPVVFAADLIPGVPWVHLPITMGYDRFPERLIDEKTALLGDLLAREGRLFFTHDNQVAVGRVSRDEKGRYGVSGG